MKSSPNDMLKSAWGIIRHTVLSHLRPECRQKAGSYASHYQGSPVIQVSCEQLRAMTRGKSRRFPDGLDFHSGGVGRSILYDHRTDIWGQDNLWFTADGEPGIMLWTAFPDFGMNWFDRYHIAKATTAVEKSISGWRVGKTVFPPHTKSYEKMIQRGERVLTHLRAAMAELEAEYPDWQEEKGSGEPAGKVVKSVRLLRWTGKWDEK